MNQNGVKVHKNFIIVSLTEDETREYIRKNYKNSLVEIVSIKPFEAECIMNTDSGNKTVLLYIPGKVYNKDSAPAAFKHYF